MPAMNGSSNPQANCSTGTLPTTAGVSPSDTFTGMLSIEALFRKSQETTQNFLSILTQEKVEMGNAIHASVAQQAQQADQIQTLVATLADFADQQINTERAIRGLLERRAEGENQLKAGVLEMFRVKERHDRQVQREIDEFFASSAGSLLEIGRVVENIKGHTPIPVKNTTDSAEPNNMASSVNNSGSDAQPAVREPVYSRSPSPHNISSPIISPHEQNVRCCRPQSQSSVETCDWNMVANPYGQALLSRATSSSDAPIEPDYPRGISRDAFDGADISADKKEMANLSAPVEPSIKPALMSSVPIIPAYSRPETPSLFPSVAMRPPFPCPVSPSPRIPSPPCTPPASWPALMLQKQPKPTYYPSTAIPVPPRLVPSPLPTSPTPQRAVAPPILSDNTYSTVLFGTAHTAATQRVSSTDLRHSSQIAPNILSPVEPLSRVSTPSTQSSLLFSARTPPPSQHPSNPLSFSARTPPPSQHPSNPLSFSARTPPPSQHLSNPLSFSARTPPPSQHPSCLSSLEAADSEPLSSPNFDWDGVSLYNDLPRTNDRRTSTHSVVSVSSGLHVTGRIAAGEESSADSLSPGLERASRIIPLLQAYFELRKRNFTFPRQVELESDSPHVIRDYDVAAITPHQVSRALQINEGRGLKDSAMGLTWATQNEVVHRYVEDLDRLLAELDSVQHENNPKVKSLRKAVIDMVVSEADAVDRWCEMVCATASASLL
ncbi:hypothetical protein EW146_g3029 [Bondarzewia mesenterica]|uniref:BAG domain-containing protein n=1 Tax=Bondarzewia mesenterica TaxID=1095465 RepID=A0A4S4LYY2_9AGAM|nr:hypothetical protein EW146_g3029 [Bondarzewia mesenterica]